MDGSGEHAADSDASRLLGRIVAGKFRIESYLGGGGMGEVYRSRWLELDQVVAIKVIRSGLVAHQGFAARFKREAKAASQLDHPNSVRIIDFGVDGDLHYMVMEYLQGTHLLTEIEENFPLADLRVYEIIGQVLAALGKAHEIGIVHRDLKPENILISNQTDDEGRSIVKVCDFGIAKVMAKQDTSALTNMGLILGTPEYMSPEQGRGDPLDARSDLYSIGVVLYHMLTRQLPFVAETPIGLVYKHAEAALVPPIQLRPDVNPAIDAVVRKAMEKNPADRFASAREMRSALREAVGISPAMGSSPNVASADPSASGGYARVDAQSRQKTTLSTARTEAAMATPAQASTRGVRTPVIAGAMALALLAIGGVIVLSKGRERPSAPVAVATAATDVPAEATSAPHAAVASAAVTSAAPVIPSAVAMVPTSESLAADAGAASKKVSPPPPVHLGRRPPVTKPVTAEAPASAAPPPAVPQPQPQPPPATSSTNNKPVLEANPFQ